MNVGQLQAQRALAATLIVDLLGPDSIKSGGAVTLLWQRSFLDDSAVMHHEYKIFGFNAKGKYIEGLALDSDLSDIVYMNEIIR